MDYVKIIRDIVEPIVSNKDALMIRQMASSNEKEDLYLVICENEDVARLIGRGGSVADAIRDVVNIAGRIESKRIRVKFESFDKIETD